MSTADIIRARIARRDRFSLREFDAIIADESDFDGWSVVYEVLGKAYYQIHPEPGMEITCACMLRYLLRCIREDLSHEHVHSGYEAAHALANCLKNWVSRLPETEPVMRAAASELEKQFRAGDRAVRDRILNGTLEHALESARVRPFFDHWRSDPVLGQAWQLAMEWAVAHGDGAEPPSDPLGSDRIGI
jgi:hypothetical protein